MRTLVPLGEFVAASGLPAEIIVWALVHGKIRCVADAEGALTVDAGALETHEVLEAFARLREEYFLSGHRVAIERCSRMVSDFFDSVLETALARARQA